MAKLWVALPVPQPTHILTCAPPVNCLTKTVWFAQRCFSWFRKLDSNSWTFNYIILDTCDDLNENNAMNQPWILAKLSHSKTEWKLHLYLQEKLFLFVRFLLSLTRWPVQTFAGETKLWHHRTEAYYNTNISRVVQLFLFVLYIYVQQSYTFKNARDWKSPYIAENSGLNPYWSR